MNNDFQKSRSGVRAKRRKTNLILNGLIILVLALIIIVAYNIFASGNDENASSTKATQKTEQKAAANKDKTEKSTQAEKSSKDSEDTAAKADETSDDSDSETANNNQADDPEQADTAQATVTDGGSSPNVVKTIVNPAWKPVGTSQSGEHAAVYDESSVDWQEMLKAITYATGIDQSNMTVYWLGRDKSTTNGSFATVASKDKTQKYNVYLQWVDGQGWMPTKMEELSQIQ
ncbi:DUF1510 family protein [Neobacillus dielmonensis]|uniref:DUF1510 family protein n=1 Tax=Neobacillus dielmonensis TaxID=1347369 RepID=UPI0005A97401|nr:DUF1510 family protein [Neobacillus dielmonensis]